MKDTKSMTAMEWFEEWSKPFLKSPKARTKEKFHVCKCDPPPEDCMCNGCHACGGIKRQYATKFRKDPNYEEII